MRKTFLRILLLLLAAAVAAVLGAHFRGGELTVYFEIPPGASSAEISFSPQGIAEADPLECFPENGRAALRLKALSAGETDVQILWDSVDSTGLYSGELEMPLRVTGGGIIFDGITYNFSGWTYLVLVLELVLIGTAVILFAAYREERLENGLYTYRSVRLLGFGIFFFVLGLLRIRYVAESLFDPDFGTVWSLLAGVSASAQTFMVRTAPVVAIFAAAISVSNVVLIRREGFYVINMLGIFIGLTLAVGAGIGIALYYSRLSFPGRNEVMNIYSGLFVYFECHLAATVKCALDAARHIPEYDKDYVVILGCRIRPDGTLFPLIRGRVDRAVSFADRQYEKTGKRAVLVPSGGKGLDECIPEADAMAEYLLKKGVGEDRILVENRSSTTRENMLFSRELIEKAGKGSRVAFSTSNYHVFRSGLLAGGSGWKIDGMGSSTVWYYWPNAFVREFFGLLSDSWVSQVITAAAVTAVSWCLALIY